MCSTLVEVRSVSLTDPARYDDATPDPGPYRTRAARPGDLDQITAVLATAAEPLAATAYLVPDLRRHPNVLPRYFRLFAEYIVYEPAATAQVSVDEWGTVDAVALWLDREDPGPPGYDKLRAAITGPLVDRFTVLDELLADATPDEPHERLVFLGVRPGRQRRGLGSALLTGRHGDLDAIGTAGFAVAPGAGVARLYERLGYLRCGQPLLLPNGADLHPMIRDPR